MRRPFELSLSTCDSVHLARVRSCSSANSTTLGVHRVLPVSLFHSRVTNTIRYDTIRYSVFFVRPKADGYIASLTCRTVQGTRNVACFANPSHQPSFFLQDCFHGLDLDRIFLSNRFFYFSSFRYFYVMVFCGRLSWLVVSFFGAR